jgi:hypothetical protein
MIQRDFGEYRGVMSLEALAATAARLPIRLT